MKDTLRTFIDVYLIENPILIALNQANSNEIACKIVNLLRNMLRFASIYISKQKIRFSKCFYNNLKYFSLFKSDCINNTASACNCKAFRCKISKEPNSLENNCLDCFNLTGFECIYTVCFSVKQK